MKSFADVDVAETGDQALVEKRGLQRCRFAGEQRGEVRSVETRPQRLDPHAREKWVGLDGIGRHQIHEAEAAWIVVDDAAPIRESEDHMIVGAESRPGMMEDAGTMGAIRRLDPERPGHAEVHDEDGAVVEMGTEIFRAPVEGLDPAPFEPLDETLGKRKPQVRPALLDLLDRRADEDGRETATDGLDLWQFRQTSSLVGGWTRHIGCPVRRSHLEASYLTRSCPRISPPLLAAVWTLK